MAEAVIAVVDTGPLLALTDPDEGSAHDAAVAVLATPAMQFVIPMMVIAETMYLVGSRLGATAEARFIAGLANLDIEPPRADDWARMAELVAQYADFPLGGTDASVVALAERVGADTVVTFDRRHFAAIRPRHVDAFTLLP